jgi:hypothetical protein
MDTMQFYGLPFFVPSTFGYHSPRKDKTGGSV